MSGARPGVILSAKKMNKKTLKKDLAFSLQFICLNILYPCFPHITSVYLPFDMLKVLSPFNAHSNLMYCSVAIICTCRLTRSSTMFKAVAKWIRNASSHPNRLEFSSVQLIQEDRKISINKEVDWLQSLKQFFINVPFYILCL